jgi:hypothetical protein
MRASTRCSSETEAPAARTGSAPALVVRLHPVLTTTPSARTHLTLAIAADTATTRSAAAASPCRDARHQRDGDATGVAPRTT